MVSGFITFVVKSYYIYGNITFMVIFYYIYGWYNHLQTEYCLLSNDVASAQVSLKAFSSSSK